MSDHKPVTAEELAEIERLDVEAPEGPWQDEGLEVWDAYETHIADTWGADVAAFIAASRDLMPRLARDLDDARRHLDTERKASAMLADRMLNLARELEALRAAVRAHEADARASGHATPPRDLALWAAAKA